MKLIGSNKAGFLGVLLMILLCGFMLFRQAKGRAPVGHLVVMTYNTGEIGGRQRSLEKVAGVIKSRGVPDLLLLQEVSGEKEASGLAKSLGLPYYLYTDYQGTKSGLAIISRQALFRPGTLYFKASRKGHATLAAELMVDGCSLLVCSVHLDRIHEITKKMVDISWATALSVLKREIMEDTIRSDSVEELLPWIAARQSDHTIIGGDFNTIPFSKTIRKMYRAFDDALWPSLSYLNGSYKKLSFPFSPRIDFIFHSPDIECKEASVIKESAGDHYPVRAVFDLG